MEIEKLAESPIRQKVYYFWLKIRSRFDNAKSSKCRYCEEWPMIHKKKEATFSLVKEACFEKVDLIAKAVASLFELAEILFKYGTENKFNQMFLDDCKEVKERLEKFRLQNL